MKKVIFYVDGMRCKACEDTIVKDVIKLNGVTDCKSNAKCKEVTVDFDENKSSVETIKNLINSIGYNIL